MPIRCILLSIGFAIIAMPTSSVGAERPPPKKKEFPWEGYWTHAPSLCLDHKPAGPPVGFFRDRIENWQEGDCVVEGTTRGSDPNSYDVLHLRCVRDGDVKYKQNMRLKLLKNGRLLLMWPGGVGFQLVRCPPMSALERYQASSAIPFSSVLRNSLIDLPDDFVR